MALLLLAIAQLRLGTPASAPRDHVLILDTSAWMARALAASRHADGSRPRSAPAHMCAPCRRATASCWCAPMRWPLPPRLSSPIAKNWKRPFRPREPGATALNLDQALAFARQIQAQSGRRAGEMAFVGTGTAGGPRTAAQRRRAICALSARAGRGRKLRPAEDRRAPLRAPIPTCGRSTFPRAITARRRARSRWRSISARRADGPGESPWAAQRLDPAAGADGEASFAYRSRAGGHSWASALLPHDAFPPTTAPNWNCRRQPTLRVTVYSSRARPAAPGAGGHARAWPPSFASRRSTPPTTAGLVILDRFIPPQRPAADSIWIDPPAAGSPIPVRDTVADVPFAALGCRPSGWPRVCAPRISSWRRLRCSKPRPTMAHRRSGRAGR